MKKLHSTLLFILITGMSLLAQTGKGESCKADYHWKVNDQIMLFAPGMAINFEDRSEGNVAAWHWDFGDGSWSEEQNPMHIFTFLYTNDSVRDPGYFIPKVCLTIKTKDGCSSTICKYLTAKQDTLIPPAGCDVYFYPYPNDTLVSIPEMIPYSFKVEAPKNTTSWLWDFGDGETSAEPYPVHSYNFMGGQYNVCLTIGTTDGCSNSYCTTLFVGFQDSTITPDCQASYTWNVMESFPLQYAFIDLSTGNAKQWFWDFGDGTFSTEQNPVHVFGKLRDSLYAEGYLGPPVSDYYKVCLTMSDGENCKSTYCDYIYSGGGYDTIYPTPCPYLISLTYSNILGGVFCNGTATAGLVDTEGNIIEPAAYYWSTGETDSKATGLCVNTPYYVSITSADGCQLIGSFALIDYSTPFTPYGYWSIYGNGNWYGLNYSKPDSGYVCQWAFSDGTTMEGDNVNFNFGNSADKSVVLTVVDADGNLVYTENIELGDATTIPKNSRQTLSLFPNPVSENINLQLDHQPNGILRIEIYNTLGQQARTEQINQSSAQFSISTDGLKSGIYFLRLFENGHQPSSISFIKE